MPWESEVLASIERSISRSCSAIESARVLRLLRVKAIENCIKRSSLTFTSHAMVRLKQKTYKPSRERQRERRLQAGWSCLKISSFASFSGVVDSQFCTPNNRAESRDNARKCRARDNVMKNSFLMLLSFINTNKITENHITSRRMARRSHMN